MAQMTVCPNCGAEWPGRFTGDWLKNGSGAWYHWCNGGRPGRWCRAREVANADNSTREQED